MDGTVIGIACAGCSAEQHAAHNGHKRKNTPLFQTITAPNGLLLHADRPVECRRHNWALYVRSGIEQQLNDVCTIDGVQHYEHADNGYNRRLVVDVPF